MYLTTLFIHSYLRWIVVLLGLIAVVRAIGASGRRPWLSGDESIGKWFIIAIDSQVFLGLLLYVSLSPITKAAFADFGAAMRDHMVRFWAVEHVTGMLVALALAHIGRSKARRVRDDAARHRTTALWFGLALLILLVTMPWPFLPYGRPLFRV